MIRVVEKASDHILALFIPRATASAAAPMGGWWRYCDCILTERLEQWCENLGGQVYCGNCTVVGRC
ncbi:hypothetical protein [Pseudonocardia sp. TRM90224]|uniref:hypothetical protein n=1 Tax=Pseudonocardia sp. TRM90224 TaxID=2812678 RepID=UPI001E4EC512|nr:hypothetical protein [Pseudonocardia sp. TRM90224]